MRRRLVIHGTVRRPMWHVYRLHTQSSGDDTLYVGVTTHPVQRLTQHRGGWFPDCEMTIVSRHRHKDRALVAELGRKS